jgi:ABC-type dipeptide/oligopeptide/nickel transport system permease subunit
MMQAFDTSVTLYTALIAVAVALVTGSLIGFVCGCASRP